MNFFQHQEKARKKTGILIFLFVCAITAIFLSIHSLISWLISLDAHNAGFIQVWLNPKLFLIDTGIVFLIVGGGSLFKIACLSSLQGDGIAKQLGGRRVSPATKELRERRLLNIVEEMAIASGIHVPNVYILDGEQSINAFAAGFTPNTSVVAVTSGALTYLNRDELQGVVAHEFSHILNGDTKINLHLIGILFGLEMIVILGTVICRSIFFVNVSSRDDEDNKGALAVIVGMFLFGLSLIIIGAIGLFFSNLIRAAVSRQREFLADASAVQFTRNPNGIGKALAKIGCPRIGSNINNAKSVESCHLFIGSVFKPGFFSSLFDSHPDLAERIRRIDPSFKGNFPSILCEVNQDTGYEENNPEVIVPDNASANKNAAQALTNNKNLIDQIRNNSASPIENAGNLPQSVLNALGGTMAAEAIAQSIGSLQKDQLDVAETLIQTIPDEIKGFVRSPDTAEMVIYSLLMVEYFKMPRADFDQAVWTNPVLKKQWNLLCSELSTHDQTVFKKLLIKISSLAISSRLPVVELAIPTLKMMRKEEYRRFRNKLIELIRADNTVDLFEYSLQHYLIRNLDVFYRLVPAAQVKYTRFGAVVEPFRQALSYLAHSGNDDPEAALSAFNAAFEYFYMQSEIVPKDQCTPGSFGSALNELAFAAPVLKQKLLTGFYYCVANDGVITESEGDLMRAVCAALDTPMPHWRSPAQNYSTGKA